MSEPNNNQRILIAEDDMPLMQGLALNLKNEGYEIFQATSGEACVNLAVQHNPHLILLDQMLTDGSGLDVCRQLRQKGIEAIIIFVTVKAQELDKVVGLEVGADDYVTKPFSLRELVARIRAHLRRRPQHDNDELTHYNFGDVELDFARFTARRKKKPIDLTPKEFEVMRLFVHCRGEVVTRDRMLESIWGYDTSSTTRTVDTHILKLRQKLEPDPVQPRYILSIYGEGYKFVG